MSDGPDDHGAPADQEKPLADLPGWTGFVALGSTIASCEALGVVLGIVVDDHWHSAPWGLLVGIVVGSAAAVASVLKLVRRFL